ncbi:MAG: DUF167 domain-containing protein [Nitrospinota bacterium]
MRINSFKDGIRFSAIIQPRSSKNEVAGIYNGALKIRLTSPPVDGAANKSCMRFISNWLGVSLSTIRIVQGLNSKNKIIEVEGLTEEQFHEILKTKNI